MARRVSFKKTRIQGGADALRALRRSSAGFFGGKVAASLALGVSLWIAGGGVAWAAEQTITGNATVGTDVTSGDDVKFGADGITLTIPADTTVGEIDLQGHAGCKIVMTGNGTVIGTITGGPSTGATFTVQGGEIHSDVYGGNTNTGAATNNTVTISDGAHVGDDSHDGVYGGYSLGGAATNNEVHISGDNTIVNANVFGGDAGAQGAAASKNKIIISGGTVGSATEGRQFYGGYSNGGVVSDNEVIISGGTIKSGSSDDTTGIFGGIGFGDSTVSANHVTVSKETAEPTIKCDIHGGYAKGSGVASGNTVTIKGGTITGNVYGGKASTATATYNTVDISGGKITGNVYGGFSINPDHDAVTGNTLNLSGAGNTDGAIQNFTTINITGATWGAPVLKMKGMGIVQNGIRPGDTVGSLATIDASKLKFDNPETIVNGDTMDLIKCENPAIINAALAAPTTTQAYDLTPVTGVTINAALQGSLALTNTALTYTATENKATKLTFGNVEWKDSGALTDHATDATKNIAFDGAAVDATKLAFTNPENRSAGDAMTLVANAGALSNPSNTVSQSYALNPVAGLSIDAALNGSVALSDNNLIYSVTSNKASKLTFTNVEWKDSGALINHATDATKNIDFNGAAVDTSNINFTNIKELEANKTMTLVSDFGNSVGTITGTKYKVGSTLEGTGKASLVGSDLIFTAETGTSQEQTHNTVMGAEVGMAALSAGNDFVGSATEGLSLASNVGADGVSSFAQMGGGSIRQETGSHVDVHTWNAILALGHQNKKERGTMEYGAFFEYGSGNYTTHNGDERGDGSTHYTGGGLLGKYTWASGFYGEMSLRAGSVHDDARNVLRDANGVPYSYETNAPYMGFHLGVGKEIPFDDIHSLDVYGKYFFNRRNGVSFNAGGHYDLDAVTSQIIRIGARYTIKRDKWNFYAGAAYEHEFDGKANGTAGGLAIRGADTSGASFRGEIGATMKPGENSPWSLDLNVAGFAGKKQGFTGGVSVAFMF